MKNLQSPPTTDETDLTQLHQKLIHLGADALSDSELLTVLIDDAPFAEASLQQGLAGLRQIPIGPGVPGLKIAALFTLSNRLQNLPKATRNHVHNSIEAYELLQDMAQLPQEHVRILLLDMDRQIIAIPTLYIGTINASVIRIAEIFRTVISHNSAAFILAHNHPASSAQPSPEDIRITREIITAAKLFDIHFIDHLIISPDDWCSIRELGLAFMD